jgi:malate synthase
VPSRRDAAVNEVALARVREDKEREAGDGFDGTWVAHPDLVPTALDCFQRALGDRPNQMTRQRGDVSVSAAQLLDVRVPGGAVTEQGLRNNLSVGIQYMESWLRGIGCVAIYNLMEDAATAEIARSQVWQWVHHGTRLDDGRAVTADLVRRVRDEELVRLREALGAEAFGAGRFTEAADLLERLVLAEPFVEFLTLPAYEHLA